MPDKIPPDKFAESLGQSEEEQANLDRIRDEKNRDREASDEDSSETDKDHGN